MYHKMKKTLIGALIVFMLILQNTAIMATGLAIDMLRTGSIGLALKDPGSQEIVLGAEFSALKVADITRDAEGSYIYLLTDSFKDSQEKLDDLETEDLPLNLQEYAETHNLTGIKSQVKADGTVIFNDLKLGLYLIRQDNKVDKYYPVNSFLVSLPLRNPETDSWIYNVDASPKVELRPEIEPTPTPVPTEPPTRPKPPPLIQTGQLKWPIPVLAIAGLLLFSFGWVLTVRKKKKDDA